MMPVLARNLLETRMTSEGRSVIASETSKVVCLYTLDQKHLVVVLQGQSFV